jgi:hypothetical protein
MSLAFPFLPLAPSPPSPSALFPSHLLPWDEATRRPCDRGPSDLRLSSLQNYRTQLSVLHRLPKLRYSAIAAQNEPIPRETQSPWRSLSAPSVLKGSRLDSVNVTGGGTEETPVGSGLLLKESRALLPPLRLEALKLPVHAASYTFQFLIRKHYKCVNKRIMTPISPAR